MSDDEKTLKGFAEFVLAVEANDGKFQFKDPDDHGAEWHDCNNNDYLGCMYYEFYINDRLRIKPEAKKGPLERKDISPYTIFHPINTPAHYALTILAISDNKIWFGEDHEFLFTDNVFVEKWLRSNDNGVTWLPCWKEETDHVCTYPTITAPLTDLNAPRLCVMCDKEEV